VVADNAGCQAGETGSKLERAFKRTYEPIDLSLFSDSIHHWQMNDWECIVEVCEPGRQIRSLEDCVL
jgi:hypothetical protein